ncbi:tumor necrosis factor-like isoform X5 [Alligator sinensis]|uniref:Tumor necrosis factor-like isoform X5 n=1 Tax=Alligator sinensis TaxID=38654 RepID=A0A3Q0FVE3_ALLSI|nr:tumor necrosis factor-like isoform X5 [Alligator sinensis]
MDQAGTRRHRRTGESSAPGSGWGHWEPEPLGSLQAGGVPAHVSPLPTATKGKRPRPRKSTPTPLYAAHYKVQPADGQTGIYTAGPDGTIRGWAETWLNASSPLRYDEARGIFTVTHGGLYYVYAQVSPRSRRQLERPSPSPGPRHQHRQRTALHLVPSHCSTNAEGDVTELWWAPALGQGHGLELSGSIVTVRQAGLYLVYSQVLFHDPTFTMGQVLWRLPPGGQGPGQILLRCVQSMPGQREQAYNSCYSGGAFHLQRGEGLRLAGPRANASLDLTPHGTFLGLVRL